MGGSLALLFALLPSASGSAAPVDWLHNGPLGASIDDLALSAGHPSVMYAAAPIVDAVYRSTNGGVSWLRTNPGLGGATKVAVSAQDPKVVYIGDLLTTKKSTDGGLTWKVIDESYTYDLAIDPSNDEIVYSSQSSAIYRTTDGGTKWSVTLAGTAFPLAIDPSVPAVVFAGTSGGVYKSVDSGGSWNLFTTGLPTGAAPNTIAVDPNHSQRVYLTMKGAVYRSLDGGESWSESSSGLQGAPVFSLAASAHDPGVVYAATDELLDSSPGVYKSADGGDHWARLTSDVAAGVLLVDPSSSTVFAAPGDDLGVFRSVDAGGTWAPSTSGMLGTATYGLAVAPTGSPAAYAADRARSGVFRSTNNGRTWQWAGRGLKHYVVSLTVAASNHRVVYAGAENYDYVTDAGVYRSVNGGATWAPANAGIGDVVNVYALAVDPTDPLVVYAGIESHCTEWCYGGIWKTTDGGITWTQLDNGLSDDPYLVVVISPTNPEVVYAAETNIYRTTNGGASWTRADDGINGTAGLEGLAVDADNPAIVYASLWSRGVWKTENAGQHWTRLPTAPTDVHDIAANPSVPGSVCTGTQHGVWCSTNYGVTWRKVPGLDTRVTHTAIGPGQMLFAGTDNHGVAVFRG